MLRRSIISTQNPIGDVWSPDDLLSILAGLSENQRSLMSLLLLATLDRQGAPSYILYVQGQEGGKKGGGLGGRSTGRRETERQREGDGRGAGTLG